MERHLRLASSPLVLSLLSAHVDLQLLKLVLCEYLRSL